MSRTYEALRKAERRPAEPRGRPRSGDAVLDISRELDDDVRLQYERIQVWMANCASAAAPVRTIMVAGCQSGNGATTTATRLAITLATRPSAQVLLVDANLRTPSLHLVFGARDQGGFNDLLGNGNGNGNGNGGGGNDGNGGDHVQATARPNLFVITRGRISRSPLETFSPQALTTLLAELKARFGVIVFDVPPLLDYPDGYALAPYFDAILLVVEADRTLVDDARRVIHELDRVSSRPVGVVLNRQRDYTPALLRKLYRVG